MSDFKAMWDKFAKIHSPLMYRDMLSVLGALEAKNERLREEVERRQVQEREHMMEAFE